MILELVIAMKKDLRLHLKAIFWFVSNLVHIFAKLNAFSQYTPFNPFTDAHRIGYAYGKRSNQNKEREDGKHQTKRNRRVS